MEKNLEEIRALDGPQLSRLAWQLGFAPTEVATIGHRILAYLPALTAPGRPWEPHVNLAQAGAVFLALRAQGWSTVAEWRSRERPAGYGWLCAYLPSPQRRQAMVSVEWPTAEAPTEAHALLLCAVLAHVAAESAHAPTPHTP